MKTASAIEKIKQFERFGSRLGLERMSVLMELLGNPQEKMKIIHVAGTNGKGSVCRYIYAMLRANGYRAGIYTSPFVQDFRERIEFDGEMISNAELEECTSIVMAQVETMLAQGLDSPTEFEVLTALAFVYFAKKELDFLILEVGLGGRGDSTNVIAHPLATVICSISLDHTDRLGKTTAEIAAEKAGIIKPGVTVFCNVDDEPAAKVIAHAAYEKAAPLVDVTRIKHQIWEKSSSGYLFSARIEGRRYDAMRVSMPGSHQVKNALAALCVIDFLRSKKHIVTSGDAIREGLESARQPGRFEVFRVKAAETPAQTAPTAETLEKPFILDGAHNEAGAKALADTMEEIFPGRKVLTIFGALKDKDVDAMLAQTNRFTNEYMVTEPRNERRIAADDLAKCVYNTKKPCTAYAEPEEAFAAAIARADEFDAIVCAGSLYLIGIVREKLTGSDRKRRKNGKDGRK